MTRLLRIATVVAMLIGLAALGPPAMAHRASTQTADVYTFADLPNLVEAGDAALVRHQDGVVAAATVRDAEPGVYTLWWVVWNNPSECGSDGCTAADFGKPGLNVDIGYAGGAVVSARGKLEVAASLLEGRPLSGFPTEFGITSGSGLVDADDAEVHLVLRSHGPRIPGQTADMLRTLNGGCVYPEGLPTEYGQPGPNICEDAYFAVFP